MERERMLDALRAVRDALGPYFEIIMLDLKDR